MTGGLSYAEQQYSVPPQPDNYIRDLIEEKVDLILRNLPDQEMARLLKLYREQLVLEIMGACEEVDCQPGHLTFEEAIEAILKWQKVNLDGQVLNAEESAMLVQDNSLALLSPMMPGVRDECAELIEGEVSMEYGFYKERKVQVFVNRPQARQKLGPVVFFWHGSNEDWRQIYRVLGERMIREITRQGGVVFAPFAGSPSVMPWHVLNPALVWKHNDFQLADQLVACAEEQFNIDDRRIYSMGFGAGGFQSAAMGRMRSNYIAGIVSYSGGQLPWFKQLPTGSENNFYSAFITYGTQGKDKVALVDFAGTSKALVRYLKGRGFHKGIECNQERGHTMPDATMQEGWRYISQVFYRRMSEAVVELGRPATFDVRTGIHCH
ncbi:hypothetical protein [Sansalvadorimonas verongulae]|uniref:hypothetical protein n=1 Tax=Sansalvadorimonas verongulae TaxID=2172824 RepID=UPI0012BD3CBD|nr:hypothetical protein [Sansalvadorimonas verongulae]MTI12855.1 hypothetical protein [Sansalvadorimonas verongulae]